MRGYPKRFNSKADVMVALDLDPAKAKAKLQAMLDTQYQWLVDRKLADTEAGITDETHRVREDTDDDGVVTERYQLVYMDDPRGPIYRLGFESHSEVESLIAGGG